MNYIHQLLVGLKCFFFNHVNSLLSQNLLACDNLTNLNTEKEHVNTLAKIILFHKHGFP